MKSVIEEPPTRNPKELRDGELGAFEVEGGCRIRWVSRSNRVCQLFLPNTSLSLAWEEYNMRTSYF